MSVRGGLAVRLLMIEDNEALALSTKTALEVAGFVIDVAFTAMQGEEKVAVHEYDAILLDLNLPDADGLELLQRLRNQKVNTPVIIVTARDEVKQRALGLDLGADDYVVKPFDLIELKSRINAVIRRFNGRSHPLIQIKALSINPQSRVVMWQDTEIKLLAKEYDILEYLASNYPKVISSEEIIEHIYDENFDPFSSVLRVHFTRLRKKLSDVIGYNVIITIRGKGVSLCIE